MKLFVCLFAFSQQFRNRLGYPFPPSCFCSWLLNQQYLKNNLKSYCAFSIFLYDFSVNLIIFQRNKQAIEKIHRKEFCQKVVFVMPVFLSFRVYLRLIKAARALKLINMIPYLMI